jgi:hypothetical protein
MVCDAVEGKQTFNPLRGSMRIPLILQADWQSGTAPVFVSKLEDGYVTYELKESSN